MEFSTRINQVTPSATLALTQKAASLAATGKDVISLAIGAPDFNTPKAIIAQTVAAIEAGKADAYTNPLGISELRQAIAHDVNTKYNQLFSVDNVAVTVGGKFSLYVLAQILLNDGDEVLIPLPYWVSYGEQVKLAGGKPVFVASNPDTLKVTPDDLDQAVSAKTKLLIINSPQNPSGVVYSKDELTALGKWAVAHDIMIIADDMYGQLVYNDHHFTSLLELDDEIVAHTILVSGFSKSYAMTGWRVGYTVADSTIIKKMAALIGHATGNLTAAAQYAALAALQVDQSCVEEMRQSFEERLNTLYPLINDLPGVSLAQKPQGAFYFFPNVQAAQQMCGFSTTDEFVKALLEEEYVAVVPGKAFGMDGHIRISYAASLDKLTTAIERMKHFILKHSK